MARPEHDPRILAALAAQRPSRRRFLGMGGVALGGLVLGPTLLAACGSDSSTSSGTTGGGGGGGGGSLTMLNWPFYIENDEPDTSVLLTGFKDSTGISVDYQTVIDSNEDFNTKYGDTLASGQGIGADLIVLTSWNCADYIKAGWVEPFDAANFPNKSNVIDVLANPAWDPGRAASIPWAVGQTGLAYYPDKVGGEITDVNAIFDPKFAGRVTILDEMRDTVGLVLLGQGINPETATTDQMLAAVAKIGAARDAGQFRKITGNSYTEDLALGDAWISVAWSGDAASLIAEDENLAWVIPEQGGMRWVDNAMIPIGAENKANAEALLNYLYQASVAGPFYEAISYIPPVKGAEAEMSPEAQQSPFIVPPPTPPLYEFEILTPEQTEEVSRAFTAATQQ
jgi:spermidine/putrescine transport system substrate-binding protein